MRSAKEGRSIDVDAGKKNAKDFAAATYYRRDELSNAATARCRSRLMLFQWR